MWSQWWNVLYLLAITHKSFCFWLSHQKDSCSKRAAGGVSALVSGRKMFKLIKGSVVVKQQEVENWVSTCGWQWPESAFFVFFVCSWGWHTSSPSATLFKGLILCIIQSMLSHNLMMQSWKWPPKKSLNLMTCSGLLSFYDVTKW